MEKLNEQKIQQYESYINEIEKLIDSIDNNKILDRQQRNRLITFLEKSVLHSKGMISVLNGTYQAKKGSGKVE